MTAKHFGLVDTSEIEVSTANGDALLFRREVLVQTTERTRRYRCRLYRLESFRLRVRSVAALRTSKWHNADYRCWVVDDNFDIESMTYRSADAARNDVVQMLMAQLGLAPAVKFQKKKPKN
jgi:hypothetical protein